MEDRNLAPIVIFAYNRKSHLEKTIESLKANSLAVESDLVVFSDGFKSDFDLEAVMQVRDYIKTIEGFKSLTVVEREKNLGLGKNIILGVTDIINLYGTVIVIEDDLILSPYFLDYMNDGLNKYSSETRVASIHGYVYPIKKNLPETFFIKGADCLGWATWKDRWRLFEGNGAVLMSKLKDAGKEKEFNFNNSYPYVEMLQDFIDGKNTSWAVRWYASAFLNDMLTLYPGKSLVYHSGNDGSGTNFNPSSFLDVKLYLNRIKLSDIDICELKTCRKAFEKYFRYQNASFQRIVYRKLKKIIRNVASKKN